MMKTIRSPFKIKHPRRIIIITAAVIVVLGLATYAAFSYTAWQNVDEYSKTASASLKQAVDDNLGTEGEATPQEKVTATLTQFNEAQTTNGCSVNTLYGWQTVVPVVKTVADTCQQRSETVTDTIDALQKLDDFYKDQGLITTPFNQTLEATKDSQDYAAARDAWTQLRATLPVLEASSTFFSVREATDKAAASVEAAYGSLAQANTDNDNDAFDEASEALTAAYGEIATLQGLADAQIQTLASALIEQYEKL